MMLAMMLRALVCGAVISMVAACGGGTDCEQNPDQCVGNPCDSAHPCPSTLVCDPITMTCQHRGMGGQIDAAPGQPDAGQTTNPPETTIIMKPPVATQSSTATFPFQSDVTTATFECSLDGGEFTSCESGQTYEALAEGDHTFAVRAIANGLTDPTPATYSWKVDTTPPDTTITGGPTGDLAQSEAQFTFTGTDPPCTLECEMDSSGFAACTSGQSFGGLTLGPHTFQVRAIDLAGNVDPTPASQTFNVTVVTPDTRITSSPSVNTNQTDASFAFTCFEQGVEVTCTFVCSLDGANPTACTSPLAYSSLAVGSHMFTVRGTDSGGTRAPSAASSRGTIDPPARVVTIPSGPNPGAPPGPNAAFTYTANEPVQGFECAVDSVAGGAFQPCSPDGDTLSGLTDGSR